MRGGLIGSAEFRGQYVFGNQPRNLFFLPHVSYVGWSGLRVSLGGERRGADRHVEPLSYAVFDARAHAAGERP
ncbi:MAG: hypothetical protein AAFV53_28960, partial [Myxococcota bacterium]